MMVKIGQGLSFVAGIAMLAMFFLVLSPGPAKLVDSVRTTALVIAAFALGVGAISLCMLHGKKISTGHKDAPYSAVLLAGLGITIVVGLFFTGKTSSATYRFIFARILTAAESSFFSMLCYYIVSAAYRAFRARNLDAAIFLVSGTLVMLGNVPVGAVIWSKFPAIGTWIMNVPNTAAMRGILLGAALGFMATSLRIIIGLERSHFGVSEGGGRP
jgi:hypothetical protein